MKIRYRWWVDAPCWFIFLITGHDMKLVIGGAVHPPPLICYSLNRKVCGFLGAGFYPYFYP